jgi:hypothetical protein
MTSRTQLACVAGRKSKSSRRAYCAAQSHTARASLAGERADTMKTANLQPVYGTESDLETENLNPYTPQNLLLPQNFVETDEVKRLLTTVPVRKPGRQMLERSQHPLRNLHQHRPPALREDRRPRGRGHRNELDALVEELRRERDRRPHAAFEGWDTNADDMVLS